MTSSAPGPRPERLLLPGDAPGSAFEVTFLHFGPERPAAGAPSVYIQAALHADELPGSAALHRLAPMLAALDREGRLRAPVTLVPLANPIGLGQVLFSEAQGRFEQGSRINFNRAFPTAGDAASCDPQDRSVPADRRLKALLLRRAHAADIALDLHCDSEGVAYLYVHEALWPGLADLAAALSCAGVLLWTGDSDGAFEEACLGEAPGGAPRLTTTVELRGRIDVDSALASADAAGLLRFLEGRGVIAGAVPPADGGFTGLVAPIDHVEMIRAPMGGMVLFERAPGERVAAGSPLAWVVARPGEEGGALCLEAPQHGYVLTRSNSRACRGGDALLKLVGMRPSPAARPGTLEP